MDHLAGQGDWIQGHWLESFGCLRKYMISWHFHLTLINCHGNPTKSPSSVIAGYPEFLLMRFRLRNHFWHRGHNLLMNLAEPKLILSATAAEYEYRGGGADKFSRGQILKKNSQNLSKHRYYFWKFLFLVKPGIFFSTLVRIVKICFIYKGICVCVCV